MTEFGVPHPAATTRAEPITDGRVVHSVFDVSRYAGSDAQVRFSQAATDAEVAAALADMPEATVIFYELPEGQPLSEAGGEEL